MCGGGQMQLQLAPQPLCQVEEHQHHHHHHQQRRQEQQHEKAIQQLECGRAGGCSEVTPLLTEAGGGHQQRQQVHSEHCLGSCWRGYHHLLKHHPLFTKSITAGVIAGLGELVGSEIQELKGARASAEERARKFLAFTIVGLLINGPLFHCWYVVLEAMAQRWSKLTGGRHVLLFMVAADRLLMAPPYLVLTLVALRYLQDFNLAAALHECRQVFVLALLTNWKVWTAAQIINFNFVPLDFRVLFGNLVAGVWMVWLGLHA